MKNISKQNQTYFVMAGQAKALYTKVGPKSANYSSPYNHGVKTSYSVMAGQAKASYAQRLSFVR